jgi:hypothetical protein
MTKALWLTVAQCCGEKEYKEKGVVWFGDRGVWKRMRDEALVLLLSVDNQ